MKPLNGPIARHTQPAPHPEVRPVTLESSASTSSTASTSASSASPTLYPEASSRQNAASRAEPRIEPRLPPLSSDMRPDSAILLVAEPRTEPRTEVRPEPGRSHVKILNPAQTLNPAQALKREIDRERECEPQARRQQLFEQRQDRRTDQRLPTRTDSRPEQRPEQRLEQPKEQRQEHRQQREPSPQQAKELPSDTRCEPPADSGRQLEESELPQTAGQPEPYRQARPTIQQQRMAGKPPETHPNPEPAPMPQPNWPIRSGPIQLQHPALPVPEPLPGEEGMPWPWILPLPLSLPPSMQGAGLPPTAADYYPSLRDAMDSTLLMLACREGHAELVAFLLESCPLAYAQALDMFGRNAAMIARDSGHPDLLALLQQAGVELQPENPALQWYLQNRGDLVTVSRTQDWQALASILSQEHFMNLRDANGRTLIFHAVMNADLEAVRFLCGCLDSPFLGWKDAYGNSVFRYTTRIANVETGAAICQELRAVRRRTRWHHKRRPWRRDEFHAFDFTEPAVRRMGSESGGSDGA